MTLNSYQKQAYDTALPSARNLNYMVFGLTNEAGEVAGKMKKVIRGDRPFEKVKEDLVAELGDVLWYVAGVATQVGVDLSKIAELNIRKLHSRQMRGKLQGDGDVR